MNDSTIALRAKEQLGKFLGKVLTHFPMPRQNFLADMLYGVQASGDTQLSSIMRAINDDSLILVDPTEIRKEFGLRMEHVTMVRDASRSSKGKHEVLVHGYHGCMASIVLATAYFASAWLGRHVQREAPQILR